MQDVDTSALSNEPSSQNPARQSLALERAGSALLLLGFAGLTTVTPGEGHPIAFLLRFAALATAFGAAQGSYRLWQRLDKVPEGEASVRPTPEPPSLPPASLALTAVMWPPVPLVNPATTSILPSTQPPALPIPASWQAGQRGPDLIVQRPERPPVAVRTVTDPQAEAPPQGPELLILWHPGPDSSPVFMPNGWRITGSAEHVLRTLEVL